MPEEERDKELVARANVGDSEALCALYERHKQWVVGLAWRFTGKNEDALEVLQDVFDYVFRQFPGFELTSSMRAFLYPVVKNTSLALIRKRRKTVPINPDMVQWHFNETHGDLERMVESLGQKLADVVRLRFVLGMKLEEIAEALDIAPGTVKSRLHRALAQLRELHEG